MIQRPRFCLFCIHFLLCPKTSPYQHRARRPTAAPDVPSVVLRGQSCSDTTAERARARGESTAGRQPARL